MSREIAGGANHGVFVDPGAVDPFDGGPSTIAILWRPLAQTAAGLIHVVGSGNARVLINPFSDGVIYWGTSGGFNAGPTYTASDGWRLDVFTKPDGTSGNLFSHRYLYDSPGWSHTDEGGTVADSGGSTVTEAIRLGQTDADEVLTGRLAAIGVWKIVLSNGDIETLNANLGNWLDLAPAALWGFNQAATTDPVLDLTGNGADQDHVTGTTVSADEPSPWSYDTSGGADVEGSAEGAYVFGGTAAGVRGVEGVAAGAFGFTGTAAGERGVVGAAAGAYAFAGAATGVRGVEGSAAGTFAFLGHAAGFPNLSATIPGRGAVALLDRDPVTLADREGQVSLR